MSPDLSFLFFLLRPPAQLESDEENVPTHKQESAPSASRPAPPLAPAPAPTQPTEDEEEILEPALPVEKPRAPAPSPPDLAAAHAPRPLNKGAPLQLPPSQPAAPERPIFISPEGEAAAVTLHVIANSGHGAGAGAGADPKKDMAAKDKAEKPPANKKRARKADEEIMAVAVAAPAAEMVISRSGRAVKKRVQDWESEEEEDEGDEDARPKKKSGAGASARVFVLVFGARFQAAA